MIFGQLLTTGLAREGGGQPSHSFLPVHVEPALCRACTEPGNELPVTDPETLSGHDYCSKETGQCRRGGKGEDSGARRTQTGRMRGSQLYNKLGAETFRGRPVVKQKCATE